VIFSNIHNFALLAPWKTASNTLNLRLGHLNESPYSAIHDFNEHLLRIAHQHITYLEFLGLPESRCDPTVGAFVRNPYDRAYSGFMQLRWDIGVLPQADFRLPWVRESVLEHMERLAVQIRAADGDFDTWFASVREDQIYAIGSGSSFGLYPCHYWTGTGGNKQIAFVGKVEDYESDLQRFCDLVGVTQRNQTQSANVRFSEQAGAAEHQYRYADRMSPASIDKINALFDRDFELFDYQRLGAGSRNTQASAWGKLGFDGSTRT